ncbi:light-harvesting complex-like protein 3 isotype 1, chloroplastic [Malus sylvestris]|uniref:light-harvesting complex-like protein 3 isotype 1, chloroplastic n=1 Tax=Malus sylvestris TaxID=3752 RepID=UPI0021AC7079|nr:light-harvesting complex-like protein 3 isotype 1, chloroplastic [Malus sylvestris]
MASIAISASLQTVCSSHQVTKQPQSKPGACSLGTKEATLVVALNVEANSLNVSAQEESALRVEKHKAEDAADSKSEDGLGGAELSVLKFRDERWKNGTWDLNMFSKNGKMDWDGMILAEAKRRKFLELHPEASTNDDPVVFRSSIIPWWAWMMRSYLPEAELINGRAAMVGFFMAYVVDALTGIGVVGQTGNFICKAGFFVTVTAIILIRRTQDLGNLRKLADEATFYDKQWQASWQDQNDQTGKKI